VSRMSQSPAYAIGVPPNIYGFHSYTWNSSDLSHLQAEQF
jgi:phosphoenolpyruvate carboxylase